MFQVNHLSVTHTRDLRSMISDFSLVLQPGDKAALIGEEGDGKSTLLKLLYDERLVSGYAEWSGEILRGQTRMGYLPQEPSPQALGEAVRTFWSQGSALTPPEEAALLRSLSLPADLPSWDRPLGRLSGGERVKLQLARLLGEQPDLLLLDEPSNDLDLETLQFLEDFLRTWPGTVLFVSHDETLIRNTANVIVHLEALRRKTAPRATVARLPYDQYVEGRRAKFQHQAQVSRKEHAEFQKQMDRFLRIRNQVERQQATISRGDPHGGFLLKKKMHTLQAMGRRFEKEKDKLTQMPELEEASFSASPPRPPCLRASGSWTSSFPGWKPVGGSWRRTFGSPSRDRRKSGSLAPTAAAKPRSSASWPGSSAPGRTSMGHTCPRTMLRF